MSKKQAPQLSRDSWIEAALAALTEGGVGKVNVEGVARRLGVTKGSFYWHFKDRQELLDAVLEYWANAMTESVLDASRRFTGDSVERIYTVAREIVANERARLDPHIRAWTQYDPRAAKIVKQIDKVRFNFLKDLFLEAGFGAEDAEIRARMLYYFVLGEHFTTIVEPMNKRLTRLRKKIELLSRRL